MKRNMDLVRDFLLAIEDGLETIYYDQGLPGAAYLPKYVWYNYKLMEEHGLLNVVEYVDGRVDFEGMTWEGHDFVDTVRDPAVWRKTKEAAVKVGGVGFKALIEIGKAVVRQELQGLGLPIS